MVVILHLLQCKRFSCCCLISFSNLQFKEKHSYKIICQRKCRQCVQIVVPSTPVFILKVCPVTFQRARLFSKSCRDTYLISDKCCMNIMHTDLSNYFTDSFEKTDFTTRRTAKRNTSQYQPLLEFGKCVAWYMSSR